MHSALPGLTPVVTGLWVIPYYPPPLVLDPSPSPSHGPQAMCVLCSPRS